MTQSLSVSVLLVLALLAANLPFVSERLLGLWPVHPAKDVRLRLAELAVLYLLIGGLGMLLEQRAGQIAPQGWEFYAITVALFLTFAFPGFVYRYLYRRKG